MIRIDGNRIWVSFSQKINTGNYESQDVSCGASVELEDDQTQFGDMILVVARQVKKAHNKIVEGVTGGRSRDST